MDTLFDLPEDTSRAGHRQPEPAPVLAFDAPTQTRLEDAITRFRTTYAAWSNGKATERDVTAARQNVVTAAHQQLDTDEHTITWTGEKYPHLINAACSCGQRQCGYSMVDFVARDVVNHVENGARL